MALLINLLHPVPADVVSAALARSKRHLVAAVVDKRLITARAVRQRELVGTWRARFDLAERAGDASLSNIALSRMEQAAARLVELDERAVEQARVVAAFTAAHRGWFKLWEELRPARQQRRDALAQRHQAQDAALMGDGDEIH